MSAIISDCGRYRYTLERKFEEEHGLRNKPLLFIMLNPSTADASLDDPTIRRCIGYAKRFKYPGLVVANLYSLRATNPKELLKSSDPVGPENDSYLRALLIHHQHAICGWGGNAKADRVNWFLCMADELDVQLWCFGVTNNGQPKHPLYLKKDAPIKRFF